MCSPPAVDEAHRLQRVFVGHAAKVRAVLLRRTGHTVRVKVAADVLKLIGLCHAHGCFVSAERIFVEWKKLLGGKSAYEILNESRDIISVFLPEITDATLPQKEVFDALTYEERQALIFALTSGDIGFSEFAASLKFDNKTKSRGMDMLRALSLKDGMTDFEIGEYLIGKSDECAISSAKISDAIGKTNGALSRIKEGVLLGTPRYVKELDFNGADAAELGYAGKKCGELLSKILRLCASLELKNEKQSIIDYIKKRLRK